MKVFIAFKLLPAAVEALKKEIPDVEVWDSKEHPTKEFLIQKAKECDAFIINTPIPMDREVMEGSKLKIVSTQAVGTDNIDLKAATELGIVVSHTPEVLTAAVADTAWGLAISVARRFKEAMSYVSDKHFTVYDTNMFHGTEISGKTMGIIGAGRIGQAIGRRAFGFDMKVMYNGPHRKPEFEEKGAVYADLNTLLKECDFVVLACPLTPQTRGMIGREQLAMMKPSAFIVNIARGASIDTEALYEALRDGVIAGAGLDVTMPEPLPVDHPLISLPNCIILPHIGSATVETRHAMAFVAATAPVDYFNGKRVRYCANPEYYNQ